MTDCCSEVLKRLDKLDDIAKMLKDLGIRTPICRRQLDALKQAQQVLESKVNQPQPAAAPTARRGRQGGGQGARQEANRNSRCWA